MTNLYWFRTAIQFYSSRKELVKHVHIKKVRVSDCLSKIRKTILIFAINIEIIVNNEVNRFDLVNMLNAKVRGYRKVGQQKLKWNISTFNLAGKVTLSLTSEKALADLKTTKISYQPCENFPKVIPGLIFFSSARNDNSLSQSRAGAIVARVYKPFDILKVKEQFF